MSAAIWIGPSPWRHQLAACTACEQLLNEGHGRGLVQMPTGTGKTRVMRALTYLAVARRRRVILCVPSEEILDQLIADLRRETRTPFYREKASAVAPAYSLITVASHQTLWRRLHRHDPRTILLFDECHHSNELALRNLSILDRFELALGFSASPWSEECTRIYQDRVLYRYPLTDAIREGYLCQYELMPFPDVVPVPTAHELYYCHDNQTAKAKAKLCTGAAYLGYDTPDAERARLVTAFRAGRVRRLYVNNMLSEGFDCPDVDTILLDKVSDSDLRLYQIVGRGLRRKADGRGLVVYAQEPEAVSQALARAG